jgi:hypothetical protein
LQRSLDEVGVAVAGEDLSRDELMLLAEAWLDEADGSTVREEKMRRELAAVHDEWLEALAAVEAAAARAADGPSAEDERQERLDAARAARDAADARHRTHVEADAVVVAITAELAAAAESERTAAEAAAEAEAAVAEAIERSDGLAADLVRIAEDLEALELSDAGAKEHLQSLSDHEYASPEDLARELGEAEGAFAAADDRVRTASGALEALAVERAEAQALVESLRDVSGPIDEGSIAEEIEWYLLARLAAQRSVCLGGSLPLLLDDALGGLDEDLLGHVLGRLERMADAVQVIVVSDDPPAAAWALSAGQDRAAVVRSQAV